MRRIRPPYALVALALAITVLLTVSLGAFHLYRYFGSYRAKYENRAVVSAQIFAESISQVDGVARLQSLTHAFVRGDILYAQVVKEGQVVAEDRTDVALSLELPVRVYRERLVRGELQLEDGFPYLEVIRPFASASSSDVSRGRNYVRVGFSLRDVWSALKSEALLVIGVGLGIVVLAGFGSLAFLAGMRNRPRFAPADEANAERAMKDGSGEVGEDQEVRVGPLRIDRVGKEVWVNEQPVDLSPKEYELVNLLASEPGRVFSNREILEKVWQTGRAPTAKDVKQYIYLVRKKLEPEAGSPQLIVTVRGFGYKVVPGTDLDAGSDADGDPETDGG